MNIILWILQSFIAFTFLYSGICKSYFTVQKLVAMGQTGVNGLPLWFVRFIGITEILGAVGLILPWLLSIYPILTPISAICLAFIMPFAAVIHYRLAVFPNKFKEMKNIMTNVLVFIICIVIAYFRMT